jgi:hypothetical protein
MRTWKPAIVRCRLEIRLNIQIIIMIFPGGILAEVNLANVNMMRDVKNIDKGPKLIRELYQKNKTTKYQQILWLVHHFSSSSLLYS